jgi:diaminopimelate epimerase
MKSNHLPETDLQTRQYKNEIQVFDVFRNQWVKLTPEENVRQLLLHYLVNEKKYKKGLISVEKQITVNKLTRRYDAVCYNQYAQPVMLIECKAPEVKITNHTFMQVAQYNLTLKVPYLLVSNGITHYVCEVDFKQGEITFLKEIPAFHQ